MLRAVLETFGADDRIVADVCCLLDVDPSPHQLHPDERPAIQRAVAKRRREFVAGRFLARRAAERLGWAGLVLPMAADRAPQWPNGLRGSITHCCHWCAIALCRREDGIAVGIDLEAHPRIDESLVPLFMSARERRLLDACPYGERALVKTVVFSAKEAAFKAQYVATRTPMDFEDIEIEIDVSAGRFRAIVRSERTSHPMDGVVLPGRFFHTSDVVGTCVVIEGIG